MNEQFAYYLRIKMHEYQNKGLTEKAFRKLLILKPGDLR